MPTIEFKFDIGDKVHRHGWEGVVDKMVYEESFGIRYGLKGCDALFPESDLSPVRPDPKFSKGNCVMAPGRTVSIELGAVYWNDSCPNSWTGGIWRGPGYYCQSIVGCEVWHESELTLCRPAPKFKVGDRVSCPIGSIGAITSVKWYDDPKHFPGTSDWVDRGWYCVRDRSEAVIWHESMLKLCPPDALKPKEWKPGDKFSDLNNGCTCIVMVVPKDVGGVLCRPDGDWCVLFTLFEDMREVE